MRAIQSLAGEQETAISAMQDRHDDPEVLAGLLELDHTNAQFARRAQAVAVLCGAWPGRQRDATPVLDVVRGATSRIRDYRRISVTCRSEAVLGARVVEPVVLALAELLDNAARHSHPGTTVEVGIRAADGGVSVVMDDAGVGMDGPTLRQAERLVGGLEEIDVFRLGDPPRFGFPVVGVLAARYGFRVTIEPQSPFGGVRVVLFLPAALLASGPAPESRVVAPGAASGPAAALPAVVGTNGLPQRRRRTPDRRTAPADATPGDAESTVGQAAGPRSPAESARRMGAFARGTRHGRTPDALSDESPDESPDEGHDDDTR